MDLKNHLTILSAASMTLLMSFQAHAQTRYIQYSTGTGFIVTREGHIVTNEHVIRNCDSKLVEVGGAMKATARIIGFDAQNDLAILQADKASRHTAKLLADPKSIKTGGQVVVVGYPKGTYSRKTSELIEPIGYISKRPLIHFKPIVNHGNSGGPVLDDAGNVIGVVVAMTESFTKSAVTGRATSAGKSDIGIGLEALKPFLSQYRVRYQSSQSLARRTPSFIESQARNFIVNLKCVTGETAK